jgi:hypothetical protein
MRVGPHVDALAGAEFRRSEMIEKDERPDHAALDMRKRAPHGEMAKIDAAGHHDEVDGVGGTLIARRRVLVRGEGHLILLEGTLRDACNRFQAARADRPVLVIGDYD